MSRALLLALLLASVATPASAQVVVQGRDGPLEVIGLRRWSVQDLEDSIARYAPGESLRSHACAAVLQGRLRFPSAAVHNYLDPGKPTYVVIALVEPQDSTRVVRRSIEGAAMPDLWPGLRSLSSDTGIANTARVTEAAQFIGLVRQAGPDSARALLSRYFDEESARDAVALAKALESLRGEEEREVATGTLRTDGNVSNRVLAAIVLSNFPAADVSWHALVAAMRDPENRVASAARVALSAMIPVRTARVDWAPAIPDLVPLLAGTNLWGYPELLDILARTGAGPDLARPLLRHNWHLVLAFARAQHTRSAQPARALLTALSGTADPVRWEPWLVSLDR